MAWSAPRTWVAAAVLTAAQLNTDVRDNMLWLGTPKGWNIRRAATVSLTNSAFTGITFDTEVTDTDNFITAPSATVTIPTGLDGFYALSFAGTTATTFSTGGILRFVTTASTMSNAATIDIPVTGAASNIDGSYILPLPATATITVSLFQASGAAVTLNSCTFVGRWLFRGT